MERELKTERENFGAYLEQHAQKAYLRFYLGTLGDRTRDGATVRLRQLGLCPRDRCVLTLDDAQAEKLAQWWRDPEHRAMLTRPQHARGAVDSWLEYRKLACEPLPHQTAPTEQLLPPEGPTAAELVTALEQEHSVRERESLLRWLLDDSGLVWYGNETWTLLRGQTGEYERLVDRLLARLRPEHTDRVPAPEPVWYSLVDHFPIYVMEHLYREALAQGGEYAQSPIRAMDRLCRAGHRDDRAAMRAAFFDFARWLLKHGDRGSVYNQSALWREDDFFWQYLEHQSRCRDRYDRTILAELLQGLCRIPSPSPEARRLLTALSGMLLEGKRLSWERLRTMVQRVTDLPERWEPLVPGELEAGSLAARAALAQGRWLLQDAGDGCQLREALERLRQGELALSVHREAVLEIQALRHCRGDDDLFAVELELKLLQARCRRLLAEHEGRAGLLDWCDLAPIREACLCALEEAEAAAKAGGEQMRAALEEEINACGRSLFVTLPGLLVSDGAADRSDRQLCRMWEESWRENWPDSIPEEEAVGCQVRRRPELPRRAAMSQDLDSQARSPSWRELGGVDAVTLSVVDEIICGYILLLKLNMLADNAWVLSLTASPGFQEICRQGYITFSPYRLGRVNYDSPRKYVLQNLLNPAYIWNSTRLFDEPGPALAGRTGPMRPEELHGARGELYRFLMGELPMSDFTAEWREPLSQLAEQYVRLDELIRPSSARQYRQPETSGRAISLHQPIRDRLESLLREAGGDGDTERADRLGQLCHLGLDSSGGFTRMEQCFQGWETLTTRSRFLEAIRRADQAGGDADLLADLECVMNHAYLELGSRDLCSRCKLTVPQERRYLLLRQDDVGRGPDSGSFAYARQRSRSLGTARFDLEDPESITDAYWRVCEQRLEQRTRDMSRARRRMACEAAAEELSREGGVTYLGGGSGVQPADYRLKTMSGRVVRETLTDFDQDAPEYVEQSEGEV